MEVVAVPTRVPRLTLVYVYNATYIYIYILVIHEVQLAYSF